MTEEHLYPRMACADVGSDQIEDHLAPRRAALIFIPNGEVRIDPCLDWILLNEPAAEGVDGRDGGIGDPRQYTAPLCPLGSIVGRARNSLQDLTLQAVPHLRSRFLREGDREDLPGLNACVEACQVGPHERRRFPGAGAGVDYGIAREGHRILLSGIELCHGGKTLSLSSIISCPDLPAMRDLTALLEVCATPPCNR